MKTSSLTPTAHLFIKAQNHKTGAMSDLLTRIEQRLNRFCYYLTGNKEAAQDLAQEAYIKVIENIDTLDRPAGFVSWLFCVTKNHFLDYVRSSAHKTTAPVADMELESPAITPDTEVGFQLMKTLDTLSKEDRYLFLLICMEGRSYEEGAEIMGISKAAVRCKIYRLRKLVKGDVLNSEI